MEGLEEYIKAKKIGQQITSMTRHETLTILQDAYNIINVEHGTIDVREMYWSGRRADMVKAKRIFCLVNSLTRMDDDMQTKFIDGLKHKSIKSIIFRVGEPLEDGGMTIECVFIRRHGRS